MKSILAISLIVFSLTNSLKIHVPDHHLCTEDEKKAEVCIMIYKPVCGVSDSNQDPKDGKTFSNGCLACASESIVSYIDESCEELIKKGFSKASPTLEDFLKDQGILKCTEEEKKNMVCTEEYNPVCGYSLLLTGGVPTEIQFENSCKACINPLVSYYKKGECKIKRIELENTKHECTSDERGFNKACTKIYLPVCGHSKILLRAAPLQVTYSNGCEACKNPLVTYWELGEC